MIIGLIMIKFTKYCGLENAINGDRIGKFRTERDAFTKI